MTKNEADRDVPSNERHEKGLNFQRGRPSCNSSQRENHGSFPRDFYSLFLIVPFFNIIMQPPCAFLLLYPPLFHPFSPPTSSKCCEAAPLRQPEIQCRFFSPPPPPLSLNCPNLSGEEALPKICSLFKQPWQ